MHGIARSLLVIALVALGGARVHAAPACTPVAPTLGVVPVALQASAGATVHFALALTNHDPPSCGPTAFLIQPTQYEDGTPADRRGTLTTGGAHYVRAAPGETVTFDEAIDVAADGADYAYPVYIYAAHRFRSGVPLAAAIAYVNLGPAPLCVPGASHDAVCDALCEGY